jgi:hypothetical protein
MKEENSIFQDSTKMSKPNERINIYSGKFNIMHDDYADEIDGHIYFKWLPYNGVYFEGTLVSHSFDLLFLSEVEVKVDGSTFQASILESKSSSDSDKSFLYGGLKDVFQGDKKVKVQKVRFSLTNFRGLRGNKSIKVHEDSYPNRIEINDEKYIITIDKFIDFDSRKRSVQNDGGYIITHCGEIVAKKGLLPFNEVEKLTKKLHYFLTFINGRRVSLTFLKGIGLNNSVVWEDYSCYLNAQDKSVLCWASEIDVAFQINLLWENFNSIWSTDESRDVLKTAIHWFVEANSNSGLAEGALIISQTALELLFNWMIVEDKGIIKGSGAYGLDASNKVRLLLSTMNISTDIPREMNVLTKYTKGRATKDGPEILVELRNWLVHDKQKSRNEFKKIDPFIYIDASRLSIWYVELALLKMLGFNGKYVNRCKLSSESGGIEFIPWSNQK